MSNKPKVLRDALTRVIEELEEYHAKFGDLPLGVVQAASHHSGYSEGHIRRTLRQRGPGHQAKATRTKDHFEVTDDIAAQVFLHGGNLAKTHEELSKTQKLPSLSTFKRYVIAHMGTGQLAYARKGSAKFRDKQLYLTANYHHRAHTYQMDHCVLDIWIVPRNHKNPVKPQLTVVMDAHTRYVLSWVLTVGAPTADEVRAALIQAIWPGHAPDGTPVGGRPIKVQWDRGKEFLADVITDACLRTNIQPSPLPAKSPHLKGRLERFFGTLQGDLLPSLPGHSAGARDLRGNSALEKHALGEDAFLVRLAIWTDTYNDQMVNSSTGKTPTQMWADDDHPLDWVAPELLWLDFLQAKDCKVHKFGVRFDTINFLGECLQGQVGRTVEIRFLPHDRTFIEVFQGGVHLGTCYPASDLTAEQEQEILVRRKQDRLEAKEHFTRANRIRNTQDPDTQRVGTDKKGKKVVLPVEIDITAEPEDTLLDTPLDENPDQLRFS
jgi:putative transposase